MAQDEGFIYGIRAVSEAVKAGKKMERIFIQKDLQGDNVRELKKLLKEHALNYVPVPPEKLKRLARGRNHQGVAAMVSAVSYSNLGDVLQGVFEEGRTPLILILDRITDVRNFGAVCRTAECSGVDAVVIPSRGGAMVGPDAIKTSAGALNRITVCREDDLGKTIKYLKDSGLRVISCSEKGTKEIYSEDFNQPVAIIMGSEEDGVSPAFLKSSDAVVKIPMLGKIGSLNVSVAAGIILYETVRQRIA